MSLDSISFLLELQDLPVVRMQGSWMLAQGLRCCYDEVDSSDFGLWARFSIFRPFWGSRAIN